MAKCPECVEKEKMQECECCGKLFDPNEVINPYPYKGNFPEDPRWFCKSAPEGHGGV